MNGNNVSNNLEFDQYLKDLATNLRMKRKKYLLVIKSYIIKKYL